MMIAMGDSELPDGFLLGDGSTFFCAGAGAGAGFAEELRQRHALVELGRRALAAFLLEPAGAGEGAEAAAVVVVQAELLAPLLAVGVLGRRQDRQGDAVRVEGLVGV